MTERNKFNQRQKGSVRTITMYTQTYQYYRQPCTAPTYRLCRRGMMLVLYTDQLFRCLLRTTTVTMQHFLCSKLYSLDLDQKDWRCSIPAKISNSTQSCSNNTFREQRTNQCQQSVSVSPSSSRIGYCWNRTKRSISFHSIHSIPFRPLSSHDDHHRIVFVCVPTLFHILLLLFCCKQQQQQQQCQQQWQWQ